MGGHTASSPCLPAVGDDRRANNIGAIRLVLAVLVVYSHSYPLTTGTNNVEPLYVYTGMLSYGSVAVDGFFLLSGYLITQSWARSPSASAFVARRVARIYPGYLVALVFSLAAGFVGAIPHTVEYVRQLAASSDQALRTVLFLEIADWVNFAGSFAGNPFPAVVNGSLWTLRHELQCYILTLGLGAFGLGGNRQVHAAILAVLGVAYWVNADDIGRSNIDFTHLVTFYFIGAATAAGVFSNFPFPPTLVRVACCVALVAAPPSKTALVVVYPPAYACLLFGLAFSRRSPGAGLFARYDLSYGVYLYAFPVQQLVVHWGNPITAHQLFAFALPITFVLAYASWRFVERPMLERVGRYTRRPA